jgi:hypothetical protein
MLRRRNFSSLAQKKELARSKLQKADWGESYPWLNFNIDSNSAWLREDEMHTQ